MCFIPVHRHSINSLHIHFYVFNLKYNVNQNHATLNSKLGYILIEIRIQKQDKLEYRHKTD